MKRAFLLCLLFGLYPVISRAQAGKQRLVPPDAPRSIQIDIYSFEFQDLYFGREGPNYTSAKTEPSKRSQQFAVARLSGQEGIRTVKFEAIDETGAIVTLLHMFKV